MTIIGLTEADEWAEAIRQILADARTLLGIERQASSIRTRPSSPEFRSAENNGQMLLPRISESSWRE